MGIPESVDMIEYVNIRIAFIKTPLRLLLMPR